MKQKIYKPSYKVHRHGLVCTPLHFLITLNSNKSYQRTSSASNMVPVISIMLAKALRYSLRCVTQSST